MPQLVAQSQHQVATCWSNIHPQLILHGATTQQTNLLHWEFVCKHSQLISDTKSIFNQSNILRLKPMNSFGLSFGCGAWIFSSRWRIERRSSIDYRDLSLKWYAVSLWQLGTCYLLYVSWYLSMAQLRNGATTDSFSHCICSYSWWFCLLWQLWPNKCSITSSAFVDGSANKVNLPLKKSGFCSSKVWALNPLYGGQQHTMIVPLKFRLSHSSWDQHLGVASCPS
jgi:hypothetical protein